jgi:hypothetical protein
MQLALPVRLVPRRHPVPSRQCFEPRPQLLEQCIHPLHVDVHRHPRITARHRAGAAGFLEHAERRRAPDEIRVSLLAVSHLELQHVHEHVERRGEVGYVQEWRYLEKPV